MGIRACYGKTVGRHACKHVPDLATAGQPGAGTCMMSGALQKNSGVSSTVLSRFTAARWMNTCSHTWQPRQQPLACAALRPDAIASLLTACSVLVIHAC